MDGTMNAAVRAQEMAWLTEGSGTDAEPVCRILTNARCLSEDIDVPTLDAVLFLSPRNFQMDVIQAVGRVMRMELNGKGPENIIVDTVSLASDKRSSDPLEGSSTEPGGQDPLATGVQGHLALLPSDWKEAVFGRIVKKVGSSLYWVDWSKDIATVANCYIHLINQLLEDPQRQSASQDFVKALQTTLNPAVDRNAAVEMLASHSMFENERTSLDAFYQAMVERIEAVHTLSGKQEIMRTLYDRFFSQAFPSMSERLGIVFTPVEVVDFIIRSANDAMHTAFKQTLANPGVAIIEP